MSGVRGTWSDVPRIGLLWAALLVAMPFPAPGQSPADAESRMIEACRAEFAWRAPAARVYRVDVQDGLRGIVFARVPRRASLRCFTDADGGVARLIIKRERGAAGFLF